MDNEKICSGCGCIIDGEGVEINGEIYCPDCVEDDFVKCYECGKYVARDEAIYCNDDGNYYCEACADDCLSWCERCEEYCLERHINRVQTGYKEEAYWCDDCCEAAAYRCENCGDWFSTDTDYITLRNGEDICERCRDDYYYCERCDSWVHYDEWNSDQECCTDCEECGSDLITGYHDKPRLEYFGECLPAWRGVWRGIGIELEIDRDEQDSDSEITTAEEINDIAGDAIYFNRDGSLNYGFEIITQPHTEAAFWAIDWEGILNACKNNGYTSHDAGTCGLHLHISREMFGTNEDRQGVAISKLIRFYDAFYSEILKVSRRTHEQANRWASNYGTTNRKEAEAYGKKKKDAGRYYAVNNTNHATVEIRITRGTLNLATFTACIDFMLTVAKNSRRISWAKVNNAGEWLKGLKPDTIEYLKKVKAFEEVLI